MEIYGDVEQEKAIDYLEKWFEDNKKLPNKIDRILLTRLYLRSAKDCEETKKLVELNYSIRLKNPDIFIDRDPTDADTRKANAFFDVTPLPGLTPANFHITLTRVINPDPKMFHCTEVIKTYIMVCDSRWPVPNVEMGDNSAKLSEGEVFIVDMEGIGMKHMTRLSFGAMLTYFKFIHQAFPETVQAIHLINSPSYVNKILAVVKPFMSKALFEMIKCHTNGLETLYEHIPQEMLPQEYGGKAGEISVLSDQFKATILEKRDYLMDPNHWKIQKS